MNLTELSAKRAPAGWVRAGLLTMLLFGIVGMHGLATHGWPSGNHGTAMAVVSAGPLQTGQAEPTVMGDPASAGGEQRAQSPDQGTDDDDLGMIGVCIVALVGLALALSLALVRNHRTLWRLSPRAWLRAPRPRSRLPRPPTLAELSLLRC